MRNNKISTTALQSSITRPLMQQWLESQELKYTKWVESKSLTPLHRLSCYTATLQWLNNYWQISHQASCLSDFTLTHYCTFVTGLVQRFHESLQEIKVSYPRLNLKFLTALDYFIDHYIPIQTPVQQQNTSCYYQLISEIVGQSNQQFSAQFLVNLIKALCSRELFTDIDLGNSLDLLTNLANGNLLEGKIDNMTWTAEKIIITQPKMISQILGSYNALVEGGQLQGFKIKTINELLNIFKKKFFQLQLSEITNIIHSINNLVKRSALTQIENLDLKALSKLVIGLKKLPLEAEQLEKISHYLFEIMNEVNKASNYPKMLSITSLVTQVELTLKAYDNEIKVAPVINVLLNIGKILQSERYKENELEDLRLTASKLFETLIPQSLESLSCKEIANIFYSAVLLGTPLPHTQVKKMLESFKIQQAEISSSDRGIFAHKIGQYLYFNQLDLSSIYGWIIERKPEPHSLQQKVFNSLSEKLPEGFAIEMEAYVAIWPVDILIIHLETGHKYVLEIDGHTHQWHNQLRTQDLLRDREFLAREKVIEVNRKTIDYFNHKFDGTINLILADIIKKCTQPLEVLERKKISKSEIKSPALQPLTPKQNNTPIIPVLLSENSVMLSCEVKEIKSKEKPVKKNVVSPTSNKKLPTLNNLLKDLKQGKAIAEISAMVKQISPGSVTGEQAAKLLLQGLAYDKQKYTAQSSMTSSMVSLLLNLTDKDSLYTIDPEVKACALERAVDDNNLLALQAFINSITPVQKKSKRGQKKVEVAKLPLPSRWRRAADIAISLQKTDVMSLLNNSFKNIEITEKKPEIKYEKPLSFTDAITLKDMAKLVKPLVFPEEGLLDYYKLEATELLRTAKQKFSEAARSIWDSIELVQKTKPIFLEYNQLLFGARNKLILVSVIYDFVSILSKQNLPTLLPIIRSYKQLIATIENKKNISQIEEINPLIFPPIHKEEELKFFPQKRAAQCNKSPGLQLQWMLTVSFLDKVSLARMTRVNSLFIFVYIKLEGTSYRKEFPDSMIYKPLSDSKFTWSTHLNLFKRSVMKFDDRYYTLIDQSYISLFSALILGDEESAINFIKSRLESKTVDPRENVTDMVFFQKISSGLTATTFAQNKGLNKFLKFCFEKLIVEGHLTNKHKYSLIKTGEVNQTLKKLEKHMCTEALWLYACAHICNQTELCATIAAQLSWDKTWLDVVQSPTPLSISLSSIAALLSSRRLLQDVLAGITETERNLQMYHHVEFKKTELYYNNSTFRATPPNIALVTKNEVILSLVLPIRRLYTPEDNEFYAIHSLACIIEKRDLPGLKSYFPYGAEFLTAPVALFPKYLNVNPQAAMQSTLNLLEMVIATGWHEGINVIFSHAAQFTGIKNSKHDVPVFYAISTKNLNILKLLVKNNASLTIRYSLPSYLNFLFKTEEYPLIYAIKFVGNDVINNFIIETIGKQAAIEQLEDSLKDIFDSIDKDRIISLRDKLLKTTSSPKLVETLSGGFGL